MFHFGVSVDERVLNNAAKLLEHLVPDGGQLWAPARHRRLHHAARRQRRVPDRCGELAAQAVD